MTSFFKILFPPLEVKAVEYEIKSILNNLQDVNEISKTDIKHTASSLMTENTDNIVSQMEDDGAKTNEMALRVISDAIIDNILSGHYHFYRGTLDIIGQDMMKVWEFCLKELRKKGYITDKIYKEKKEWLQNQINRMG